MRLNVKRTAMIGNCIGCGIGGGGGKRMAIYLKTFIVEFLTPSSGAAASRASSTRNRYPLYFVESSFKFFIMDELPS